MIQHILASSIGVIGGADGPTAVFVTENPEYMHNITEALGIMGKGPHRPDRDGLDKSRQQVNFCVQRPLLLCRGLFFLALAKVWFTK